MCKEGVCIKERWYGHYGLKVARLCVCDVRVCDIKLSLPHKSARYKLLFPKSICNVYKKLLIKEIKKGKKIWERHNNKKIKPVSNSDNGEVSDDMIFNYKQTESHIYVNIDF